ncbi:MAG: hypothetical protein WC793_02790 [Candidatus Paceibacterota bacterium]|jgi:hypothetical protein
MGELDLEKLKKQKAEPQKLLEEIKQPEKYPFRWETEEERKKREEDIKEANPHYGH